MNIRNFEWKARVNDLSFFENKLLQLNPIYIGNDEQTDTYFTVSKGRLKLREGNIENALIQYQRANVFGSKQSDIILYKHIPDTALKNILTLQFGVKMIVKKLRSIYFMGNVKFHFDTVEQLGTFIEVEAIDETNTFTPEELKQQCDKYLDYFELRPDQVIDKSYSDMLMNPNE